MKTGGKRALGMSGFLLILAAFFFCQTSARSQAEPGLTTTTQWIANNLPAYKNSNDELPGLQEIQALQYTVIGCQIHIYEKDFLYIHPSPVKPSPAVTPMPYTISLLRLYTSSGYRIERTAATDIPRSQLPKILQKVSSDESQWDGSYLNYTLSLEFLDLSHVEVSNVTINAVPNELINSDRLVDSDPEGGRWIRFLFFNSNADIANRAARAIRHAIKLCGGKSDPF